MKSNNFYTFLQVKIQTICLWFLFFLIFISKYWVSFIYEQILGAIASLIPVPLYSSRS